MSFTVFDGALGLPKGNHQFDILPSRCVVLVPFQGRIVSQCQAGLLDLEKRGYVVRRIEGYSAIDQARNQLASDTLADGFDDTMQSNRTSRLSPFVVRSGSVVLYPPEE